MTRNVRCCRKAEVVLAGEEWQLLTQADVGRRPLMMLAPSIHAPDFLNFHMKSYQPSTPPCCQRCQYLSEFVR